ncbi:MAG: UbiA-like polyprenyltransferase [Nitrospinaceae bacterium]
MPSVLKQLGIILADIKVKHTIFALPFAIMSAFLAAEGPPAGDKLLWILVCLFGARNAAMAFNRIADARFDALNPRTQQRALPAGKITPGAYWIFLVLSAALFVFAAGQLNALALMLSPVALCIIFFYSLTKRFTWASHLFLGLALSIAPVGAWVAVREDISLVSLVLGAAVVFWLVGFDILYSCLDVQHDKKHDLHSVPGRFGVPRALRLASGSHLLMVLFLLGLMISPLLGWLYLLGVMGVAVLLVFEHSLVRTDDLSQVNVAFFNVNGIISLFLMVMVIADCVWL